MMTSPIHSFFKIYGKVFGLLATMAIGALFPQAHVGSFLIQYLLMVMLFFSFLDIKFKPQTFQKSVLWILLANMAVGFLSYALLISFGSTFALTAFMTAIAPTATLTPTEPRASVPGPQARTTGPRRRGKSRMDPTRNNTAAGIQSARTIRPRTSWIAIRAP